jgi:hypothetical protein
MAKVIAKAMKILREHMIKEEYLPSVVYHATSSY